MNDFKRRNKILFTSLMKIRSWLKEGKINTAAEFLSLWWYEYEIISRKGLVLYRYNVEKRSFLEYVESFECDQLTEIVFKNMADLSPKTGPTLYEFLNENWRRYNTTNPREKQMYLPFKTEEG